MSALIAALENHLNPMAVALCMILIIGLLLLILIQLRKDTYDLRYLIVDTETKQPSLYKLGNLTALIVSTWGFVYLTLHDNLSEFYFTAYMSIWAATNVGNNAFQKWLELRTRLDAPPKDPQ